MASRTERPAPSQELRPPWLLDGAGALLLAQWLPLTYTTLVLKAALPAAGGRPAHAAPAGRAGLKPGR